jgi:molybdopterin converting factor small subunit
MKAIDFVWIRKRIGKTNEGLAPIAAAREIAFFPPMTGC